jgi:hypothetical protein
MIPFGSDAMFVPLFMIGFGVFLFLIGYWAWGTAVEAEGAGRDVVLRDPIFDSQTTYRKPWLQKFGAIAVWLVSALFIGGGIWLWITV